MSHSITEGVFRPVRFASTQALYTALFSGLLFATSTSASPIYHLLNLGRSGGQYFGPGGSINNSGQIAGTTTFPPACSPVGCVVDTYPVISGLDGSNLHILGVPGGPYSFGFGFGINDSGQVTGYSQGSRGFDGFHAFLSGPNGSSFKDLGTLMPDNSGISVGYAVNASGQVTGAATYTKGGDTEAFLSGPNGGQLKGFGGSGSIGWGVNASGQVTGYAGFPYGAFITGPNGTSPRPLPGDSDPNSTGFAINGSGQVAGVFTRPGGPENAFLSAPDGGPVKALGSLEGPLGSSGAVALNSSGTVVGWSENALQEAVPFVYVDGQMYDLTSLVVNLNGDMLLDATGINDSGEITGVIASPTGEDAYILVPVPEPSPIGLAAMALIVLLAHRRLIYRTA